MKCINGESVPLQVQVRFQSKAKQNRSSSAHFHSENRQSERELQGTVSAVTSSDCFLKNIRSMNQTSYLQNKKKKNTAMPFPSLLPSSAGSTWPSHHPPPSPLPPPPRPLPHLFFYGQGDGGSLKVFGYQSGSL